MMVEKDGIYLCEVKGLRHNKYMVIRRSDGHWWQYHKNYYMPMNIEGWIGLDPSVEIVRVIYVIEEEPTI